MRVSKKTGTPKWMVKIMENPMNKWMIWGYHYFWKHLCRVFKANYLEAPKQKMLISLKKEGFEDKFSFKDNGFFRDQCLKHEENPKEITWT